MSTSETVIGHDSQVELPMFPLGTVLFPSAFLPLHVFEPRYRTLTRECLADQPQFGVVLIQRGSEVGGGDVRTDVGTVARILEAVELSDGRYVLSTVGVRRFRVERWLPEQPYPRAEVVDFDDPPPGPGADETYGEVQSLLRKALALLAELGESVTEATIELAEGAGLGSYQASALAPLPELDKQVLLSTPTAEERLSVLRRLLVDEVAFLERRLQIG
jgi:Lon protease-like protein